MSKTRYIMVGGFLGAGKTTAILKLAQHLRDQGQRVGLITNDQSYGLVDTTMLASHGFDVEEITGGCFCCRFNSLVDAADKLSAQTRPDVFIAEPVGSCTDLKATVDYPLRRMYGDAYAIAPLSVLVDPVRALRILGVEQGKSFSQKVTYIYAKQLEEADIIVVNKADLLTPERLEALRAALSARFPRAAIQVISARTGRGLEEWIDRITSGTARTAGAMDVDYEEYAEGEALLGWLNATVDLSMGAKPQAAEFDGNDFLTALAARVQNRLRESGAEVAHLKMTLAPAENGNDLAVANLVRGDATPELSHRLHEPLDAGQLILNLRAEADPEVLKSAVTAALTAVASAAGVTARIEHLEHFRPGKPTPTHRLAGI
ncbi:MAG: GTP-binding protein [Phycisphaerae bacterium]|nr:GTP-binding protein [Tepidisphaeraceae bacterium]